MADDRQERHLVFTVTVSFPMLDIDHTDDSIRWSDYRYREKGFVFVLWEGVKDFESRILACVPRDGDWLDFLCYPARNSLSNAHRNFSDQPGMRILRGAKN